MIFEPEVELQARSGRHGHGLGAFPQQASKDFTAGILRYSVNEHDAPRQPFVFRLGFGDMLQGLEQSPDLHL